MIDDEMMENAPILEVLIRLMESHVAMARHAEDQRATMTNFLFTISGILIAFIVQQRFSPATLIISILIIVLGLFGVFASVKYAQHFHLHYAAGKFFEQRLHLLVPEAGILEGKAQSREQNSKRYPFMRKRISVVAFWLFLHSSICVIGIASVILTVFVVLGYRVF